jgi:RNase adaptor protein for sRNA GlmZ degradation
MKDRGGDDRPTTRLVRLWSFGARDGRGKEIPTAAKLVDCLRLSNPHGQHAQLSGLDQAIRRVVMADIREEHAGWWSKIRTYCLDPGNVSVPGRAPSGTDRPPSVLHVHDLSQAPRRPVLDVAFYCFGGRHRSVACAELLATELRTAGIEVETYHSALRTRKLLGTRRSFVI